MHQLWSGHQAAHVSKYLLSSWDFYRSLTFLSFSPYAMGQAMFAQFQGETFSSESTGMVASGVAAVHGISGPTGHSLH